MKNFRIFVRTGRKVFSSFLNQNSPDIWDRDKLSSLELKTALNTLLPSWGEDCRKLSFIPTLLFPRNTILPPSSTLSIRYLLLPVKVMVLAKMEVLPQSTLLGLACLHSHQGPGGALLGIPYGNTRGGEAGWPSCLQGLELMLNQRQ